VREGKEVVITPPPPPARPSPSPEEVDWEAAQEAVRTVSNKWVLSIIAALADGPLRYSDLQRSIGPAISPKVLAETLRVMQHNRLLGKEKAATPGTAVPYELTQSAEELLEPLAALARWHSRATAQ